MNGEIVVFAKFDRVLEVLQGEWECHIINDGENWNIKYQRT